jgi:hypothetical protein
MLQFGFHPFICADLDNLQDACTITITTTTTTMTTMTATKTNTTITTTATIIITTTTTATITTITFGVNTFLSLAAGAVMIRFKNEPLIFLIRIHH